MKVYELVNDVERYQWLRTRTWDDHDPVEALDGRPVGDNWGRVRVKFFTEKDNFEKYLPSDFPYLIPGIPVLTPRSLSILRALVESHGEILPLVSDDGHFFALNITTVIPALDYGRSEITYFSDGGVMDVKRYAFIPDRVVGLPIFKLPEFPRGRVFVTDSFVERVRGHGLTGLLFNLLWEE